jgi:PKD repeat protein
LFGDLKAGDVISPIDVRTRTGADVVPSRDTLPNGDYVVQGIKACANNAAPLALLGVDKQFGEAPLNVTFSVSGGVGTPGTELDSYVLDFGDGNQTEGSFAGNDSLSVDHSYAANGNFPARLTITDSEGAASENRAERIIQVGEKAAGSGNADQGRFGGSLGLALLLPLTLLALLRRRRH